jgi:hypothetical protein
LAGELRHRLLADSAGQAGFCFYCHEF